MILNKRSALILVFALTLLGALMRFVGLDTKAYGNDEATTSLRTAGYTIADYQTLFDGRPRSVNELDVYQGLGANKSDRDVVTSLASEDPQHPPIFYLLERHWLTLFGTSVAAHRSLAALVGVAVIPFAALLAWELFASWGAVAASALLFAVSPFQVLYAQQAREYSLWTLCTLGATILLVRVMANSNPRYFAAYFLVCIVGCYTDLLFVLVLVAHAIVLVGWARGRARLMALLGLCVVAVAYLPWLRYVVAGAKDVTNNAFLAEAVPLKVFVGKWLFNITAVTFDGAYASRVLLPFSILALLMTIAGIAIFFRRAPQPARIILATLMAVVFVTLVVPDLMHHQSRSTATRYLTPLWLAIQLALAFAVVEVSKHRKWLYSAQMTVFLVLGLLSYAVGLHAKVWWTDGSTAALVAQQGAIAARRDLPVAFWEPTGRWDFSVMELVNVLPPEERFVLYPNASRYEASHRSAYVLDASAADLRRLRAAAFRLTEVPLGPTRASGFLTGLRAHDQAAQSDGVTSLWRSDVEHST